MAAAPKKPAKPARPTKPVKPKSVQPSAERDALRILRENKYLDAKVIRVMAEADETVVLFLDCRAKKKQVKTAYFTREEGQSKVNVFVKEGWDL